MEMVYSDSLIHSVFFSEIRFAWFEFRGKEAVCGMSCCILAMPTRWYGGKEKNCYLYCRIPSCSESERQSGGNAALHEDADGGGFHKRHTASNL